MNSFLLLPLEVRQMIYELALVIRDVYPYYLAEHEEMCPGTRDCFPRSKPNLNILATCRLIHIEASPIVYGKNTFMLPVSELTVKFFTTALHTRERQSWVKSVKLSLTAIDLTPQARKEIADKETEDLDEFLADPNMYDAYFERAMNRHGRLLHQAYKRKLLCELWPQKVECILKHLTLDEFWLDIGSSYCHQYCCDLRIGALAAFTSGFAYGMPKLWHEKEFRSHQTKIMNVRSMIASWTQLGKKKRITLEEGYRRFEAVFRWMKFNIYQPSEWIVESARIRRHALTLKSMIRLGNPYQFVLMLEKGTDSCANAVGGGLRWL